MVKTCDSWNYLLLIMAFWENPKELNGAITSSTSSLILRGWCGNDGNPHLGRISIVHQFMGVIWSGSCWVPLILLAGSWFWDQLQFHDHSKCWPVFQEEKRSLFSRPGSGEMISNTYIRRNIYNKLTNGFYPQVLGKTWITRGKVPSKKCGFKLF